MKEDQDPDGLDDEGREEDRLEDDEEVAPRRVQEGALDDLPPLEGDPPAHQAEEDDGKGDDPQPPDLEEDERDRSGRRRRGPSRCR